MSETLRVAAGLVCGLAPAVRSARVRLTWLRDATLAATSVLMLLVGAVASWVPANRSTRSRP